MRLGGLFGGPSSTQKKATIDNIGILKEKLSPIWNQKSLMIAEA
jgi:hypothetical protein